MPNTPITRDMGKIKGRDLVGICIEAVRRTNQFLEENEFPYRLDSNYFLKLVQNKGYNEKEVFGVLGQCKKHLGIDKVEEL